MPSDEDKVGIKKDLMTIKDEIRKPVGKRLHKNEVEQITAQLKGLTKDIEEIKSNIANNKDSHTKLKKKKEIIYLIKKSGRINASQLSEEIDLSRTRCSEYLNELKREGILNTKKDGRSKYYMMDL